MSTVTWLGTMSTVTYAEPPQNNGEDAAFQLGLLLAKLEAAIGMVEEKLALPNAVVLPGLRDWHEILLFQVLVKLPECQHAQLYVTATMM